MMALISFTTMLEHLQSLHSLLANLLTDPEGLHYGDVHYMLLQHTLKMQHVPYTYFTSLIQENNFQLEGVPMDVASHTTTILLVFLSDDQLQTIEYVHIGLVVCHAGCQLYEQKTIPCFIKSIEDHMEKVRLKWEACGSSDGACSFTMFVVNFGSLIAVPTEPPYCLVYPNIYATSVPPKDRNHFNIQGGPPALCTHVCICHALLQHADLSEVHRQKYHGSHVVIPQGAQYNHLLPKITMPHNQQAPLIDLHMGESFPMVPVEDFQLVDKIFPGMPRDSLLYNSDDLTKLQKMRFQVTMHQAEESPTAKSKGEKPRSFHASGEVPSSTCKEGEPSKSQGKSPWAPSPKTSTDALGRKSLHHHKCSPPSKEPHGTHDKDSHGSSSKHRDQSHSDKGSKEKESSKSLWKHATSPLKTSPSSMGGEDR